MRRPVPWIALVASCWALLVLAIAAPSWFPSPSLLVRVVSGLAKPASPDAGILEWVRHHGLAAGLALAVLAVQAGLGGAVLRWVVPRGGADLLRAWGAGFGIMGLALLGWGLAGLLSPVPVLLSTVLPAAAGGVALWRRRSWGGWPVFREPWTILLAATVAAAAAVLAGFAVVPDTSWDALVYHLRLPAFFTAEHRIFHIPTIHFSAFPLGTEMAYGWIMLVGGLDRTGGGEAMKLVHAACAGIAAAAAGRVAVRIAPSVPGARLFAAALVLASPLTGTIGVRAYNDFVQAAFAGLVLDLAVARPRGGLRLAGLLAGAAFGAKYTAVLFAIPAALLWFRRLPVPYLFFGGMALPWIAKNVLLTGNPVAPFLGGMFPSGPETAAQFAAYAGPMGSMSANFGSLGAVALGLVREPAGGESFSELLLVLPVLAAAFGGLRDSGFRAVGSHVAILGALWFLLAPSQRFAAMAMPALAALSAAGLWSLASMPARPAVLPVAGVLVLLNLVRLPVMHTGMFDPWRAILGRETAAAYLERTLYPGPFYAPVAGWGNRNLPAGARVLVMVDIKAHYLWRRTYHDFQYQKPGLFLRWMRAGGSVPGFLKRLRQEGVTHLLVVYQRTRDVGDHCAWEGGELGEAAEFLATHTRRLYGNEKVSLLEILREPAPRRAIPESTWLLFVHPENLMMAGADAEAVSLLRATLARTPWLREARGYLGVSLARLQRFDEALPVLRRSAAEGGDNAFYAAYVLGQILASKGDRKGAIGSWRDAVRLRPDFSEGWFRLAQAYESTGRRDEARDAAGRALVLDPGNEQFRQAAAALGAVP